MKEKRSIQQLREECFNVTCFPIEVLNWIEKENLWNLWVPRAYGGLEKSFTKGLQTLKSLAKIDGSLGWTITLCSGANFFIGNLKEETAQEIFLKSGSPVCFGGSGGAFGTAEKLGDHYKISGKWRYATGAPYLSHFTLNARIIEKGKEVKYEDGTLKVLSFVLPKEEIEIIEDWNTMGLVATATHSFRVEDVVVGEQYSFLYNRFYHAQPIYKIQFSIFAYLTLWINYVGMAEHFLEEAQTVLPEEKLERLTIIISEVNASIFNYAEAIEKIVSEEGNFTEEYIQEIHKKGKESLIQISGCLIEIYPSLGVKASRKNHPINQIFRDYFTATQHHVFV